MHTNIYIIYIRIYKYIYLHFTPDLIITKIGTLKKQCLIDSLQPCILLYN